MKRPLALIGLTSMLVLTVCFYADYALLKWISGLSLAGLILSLIIKSFRQKVTIPVFFSVVLISVLFFTSCTELVVKPVQQKYGGEDVHITATLCEEGVYDRGRYFYTLKTHSINGEEAFVKIMLGSSDALMCDVGDKLTFTASINPAYYGGYLADRVYLSANVFYEDSVSITKADTKPFYFYFVELRDRLRSAFYIELDYDPASLATAVLLGDKSGFSDEVRRNLRYAGLSHVAVVSGLHLSIITMLYYKTFGKLFKNKYANAVATFLLVLFFLCLTGFGKSSIRAVIMLFILILSGLFNRENDSVNVLGFAALLMCAFNPYIVGDVGVLLSFSATFGIVAFSQKLENFLTQKLSPVKNSKHKLANKTVRYIATLFSTTFTAVLATLPVTVVFFGRVSLVQIFSNLLVLPFVQFFMIFSAVCAVFHYTPYTGFLAELFGFLANLIGKLMLYIAELFASLPFAYVKADYAFVLLWIFASISLLSLAYALRRKGRGLNFLCFVMSVAIIVAGTVGHLVSSQNKLTVYVTPSKFGHGIILAGKDGNALLSVTGDNFAVENTTKILEGIYTENQLMIVDTDNKYAYNNSEIILSEFDYKQVLMYDKESDKDYTVTLWDKATFKVFEVNSNVYQHLAVGDTSILILPSTGDVLHIPEELRSPDVLVTSGIVENMELLSFKTLISNGSSFKQAAVIDFYRERDCVKIAVMDTVNFDIVG